MKVFIDLLWFFKEEKRKYLMGILLLAFVSLLSLLPPYIVGVIVDHIEKRTLTFTTLFSWGGVLFAVAVAVYIFRYFWRIMIFGASIRLARKLRNQLYEHFTKMSPNFYHSRRTGDLMAHSTNDIRAVEQTAGIGVLTLVDSLLMGSFVIITMAFTISWKLTLICLIPMPFMALATSYYGSLLHERFGKAQAAFSSLNDKVQESMSGIRVIKTFGYEKDDVESFREKSEDVVQKNISVAKVDALFDPTISLIVSISFFLSILFGARYVVADELTIGQLTSFTIYLGLLIWPMLAFGWLFNIVERGRASYNRVSSLLSVKADIEDAEKTVSEQPIGTIEYRINRFTYTDEEVVLQDVSFHLNKGETLGVVGRTGSGKTTLMKLFMRQFDLTDGDIYFSNRPIKEYSVEALRKSIGYVPQDHFLFSATIGDNIAFAKPKATMSEIIEAAKLASIHEDIIKLPDGYETIVGERGVTLSGGQKQRISIARALIANPEVLILDDSLSAVDAKTEEAILEALRGVRRDKTTMITAHRLSAIKHANLIVVLDHGKIVQKGTHDELMSVDGWYKEMYEKQKLETLVEQGGSKDE
ncbi:ABC transporter transmembrane domain-containing protein [Anaerobacillus isosaccharinicus]|uniref:ATP-binding cassette domain-containing protein n=1 Tax=Anaerobacillus isosaccharinicus TaxID=1532552 RepID=A0A1S2M9B8_9BACI|nr:ABC transporter transmembrane domain-containing protein [Anaerobacillus isosaccharinicus]MBA5587233.1 ATP-binding cassette domain-containing protein [Anaerobacillus isosaccharinicus]QOY34573.1 ATP-binding cassette domain-containing protein [Anaerobacillus isosaccharinicus]